MTYHYRPAAEEMADAKAWLFTEEGHAWQNEQALKHGSCMGMNNAPWIKIKTMIFGDSTILEKDFISMEWFPQELTPSERLHLYTAHGC